MIGRNLTFWPMRAGFCLLAFCAVGSFAATVYGMQTNTPVLSVFRTNVGFVDSNKRASAAAVSAFAVPMPADYDGDGNTDAATWEAASGRWHVQQTSNGSKFEIIWGNSLKTRRGTGQAVAVPADYDGDGKADIAIWRAATGDWHILNSSSNFDRSKAVVASWGMEGDVPVQADYDGDSKADLAVFRPAENRWLILESKTGSTRSEYFGIAGTDLLVPTDYTGDGKADIAVYRRGTWLVLNSGTGETEPFEFGFADAQPVPGDYDGDGETDFAVYRSGMWYVYESSSPRLLTYKFGSGTDVPLSSTMAKQSIARIQ